MSGHYLGGYKTQAKCECGQPATSSFWWHDHWVHVCKPCYMVHPVWDEGDL